MDVVSIIIPIYNVSDYLDTCIASVCCQTYRHLEIILVDDGSSDDSGSKCDGWAKKDTRIRVVHKSNGGLSDARNAGLDVATGKYIYFLDGDDYIEPELIETALGYMAEDVDLVVFQYWKEWPDGMQQKSQYHIGRFRINSENERTHFVLNRLLRYEVGWEAWSRVFRRDAIERRNLRFVDNKRIFAEDLYFMLCYCAHARNITCIPNRLHHYIQRTGSIMGQNTTKLNIGRIAFLADAVLAYYVRCGDCGELIDSFPAIYYLLISNEMDKAKKAGLLPLEQAPTIIKTETHGSPSFQPQMKALLKSPQKLASVYPTMALSERMAYLRYLLNGSLLCYRINLRRIYLFAKPSIRQNLCLLNPPVRSTRQHYDIYVIGTEDFGNIGDHQIAISILTFLKKNFQGKTVLEISASNYQKVKPFLQNTIRGHELIVLTGGGNFGDIYPFAQNLRQDVIETWPHNPKIVFPQTIHFSGSLEGKRCLQEAQNVYSEKNNIILTAREKVSYHMAREYFSCDSILIPDIVLSQPLQKDCRRGAWTLLCMRQDAESQVDPSIINDVIKILPTPIRKLDNQLDYSVSTTDRERTVDWILENFQYARLVITDRLHGMVFAAITGTPCIVFRNYNHKVQGTYEWISHLPYIRFATNLEDAKRYLPELLEMKDCQYDKTPLEPYFEKLAEVVKQCL